MFETPESPFQHVLNTNYAADDTDTKEILNLCASPEAKIAELDLEAERLQTQLAAVYAQRKVLAEFVDSHKALLSPIRRLSLEILQTVFTFCLPEDRNCMMHASEGPVLLGRVCKLWRDTVFNSPRLWSSVHVVIPSPDNPFLSKVILEALREWLSRTGVCPLHISVVAQGPYDSTYIFLFLELIIPLMSFWGKISINLPLRSFELFEDATRAHSSKGLPVLKSFAFIDSSYEYDVDRQANPPAPPFHFLNVSPNLARLCLVLKSVLQSKGLMPRSPSQIRELRFDSMTKYDLSLADFMSFLGECQNLASLQVQGWMRTSDELLPTITLQRLSCLKLGLTQGQHIKLMFLDHVVTPVLTDLHISQPASQLDFVDFERLFPSISRLNNPSGCSLRKLIIECPSRSPGSLQPFVSILGDLTDLTHLTINCMKLVPPHPSLLPSKIAYSDDIWPNFIPSLHPATGPCCPKLENLKLINYCSPTFNSLLSLIRERVSSTEDRGQFKVFEIKNKWTFPCTAGVSTDIPRDFRSALQQLQIEFPEFTADIPDEPKPPRVVPWLGLPEQP